MRNLGWWVVPAVFGFLLKAAMDLAADFMLSRITNPEIGGNERGIIFRIFIVAVFAIGGLIVVVFTAMRPGATAA